MSSQTLLPFATLAAHYARLSALSVAVGAANALAPIAEAARAGNRTRLKTVGFWLDRLGPSGELGKGVNEGTFSAERWASIANQQGAELNSILKDLHDENLFSRLWTEVVVPTARTAGDTVVSAAGGAGFGFGAVAALVLVVWAVRR